MYCSSAQAYTKKHSLALLCYTKASTSASKVLSHITKYFDINSHANTVVNNCNSL